MTVDQLIRHLGQCRKRIKQLRDDNQRIWESREEWKAKHRALSAEAVYLRQSVKWLTHSRDMWKAQAAEVAPLRRKLRWMTRSRDQWKQKAVIRSTQRPERRPCTRANVRLRAVDLERILEMPARD